VKAGLTSDLRPFEQKAAKVAKVFGHRRSRGDQANPLSLLTLRPSVQSLSSLPFVKAWPHVFKPSAGVNQLPGSPFETEGSKGSKGFWTPDGSSGDKANPPSLLTLLPSVQNLSSLPSVKAWPHVFKPSAGINQLPAIR
jgi:hypothetical protein